MNWIILSNFVTAGEEDEVDLVSLDLNINRAILNRDADEVVRRLAELMRSTNLKVSKDVIHLVPTL